MASFQPACAKDGVIDCVTRAAVLPAAGVATAGALLCCAGPVACLLNAAGNSVLAELLSSFGVSRGLVVGKASTCMGGPACSASAGSADCAGAAGRRVSAGVLRASAIRSCGASSAAASGTGGVALCQGMREPVMAWPDAGRTAFGGSVTTNRGDWRDAMRISTANVSAVTSRLGTVPDSSAALGPVLTFAKVAGGRESVVAGGGGGSMRSRRACSSGLALLAAAAAASSVLAGRSLRAVVCVPAPGAGAGAANCASNCANEATAASCALATQVSGFQTLVPGGLAVMAIMAAQFRVRRDRAACSSVCFWSRCRSRRCAESVWRCARVS